MNAPVEVRCDLATPGEVIGNRFSNMSFWHYLGTTPDERAWHEWAEEMPAGWVAEHYPWLEEMQIFIATGGAYRGHVRAEGDEMPCEFDRDLFIDPADRSTMTDYDFAPLVRACKNMVTQGVKPCLKLHAVPIKYSSDPRIGWFRVNVRPPDDYEVYGAYLRACVQALVDALGLEEVRSWRWYVMTEMDNAMWWQTEDGSPEGSAEAFLKMYDHSVAALEEVLGEDGVQVGAHAMSSGTGLWDERKFLDHCVYGTNRKTGETGSRLDFFAVSYYDRSPGRIESDTMNSGLASGAALKGFAGTVQRVRACADALGLHDLPIEVSEGGVLFGMDGRWLWHGLCAGGVHDASWTALSFKKVLDLGVTLWSRWPMVRTGGLFHGLEVASTHLLRLVDKMRADRRLPVSVAGTEPGNSIVDAVAGHDGQSNTARVLLFHHVENISLEASPKPVTLLLSGLTARAGETLTVRRWVIDEEHGDFWKQWEADRAAHGITESDYKHSCDQVDVNHALLKPEHRAFWREREEAYGVLSELREEMLCCTVAEDGTLTLEATLAPLSVVFYEIEGVVVEQRVKQ